LMSCLSVSAASFVVAEAMFTFEGRSRLEEYTRISSSLFLQTEFFVRRLRSSNNDIEHVGSLGCSFS
jgi:hypothetical protein